MKNIIEEILNGKASAKKRKRFFRDIEFDEDLADEYARAKSNYVFDNLPYTQDELTGNNISTPKLVLRRTGRFVIKFAAILAIPLSIYFVYDIIKGINDIEIPTNYVPSMAEIVNKDSQIEPSIRYETRTGVIGLVTLPDSSTVWLNSGSYIEFPAEFDSTQRVVNFYGEGYFMVNSNAEWPMKINTSDDISIIVRGTEFNLNNYCNSEQFKLFLVEGNLSIYRGKANSIIQVGENNEIIINKNNEKSSAYRNINPDKSYITAWKHGIIKFKNTPMTEVAEKLSNWYGYNIIIYNDKVRKHRFTGEFESESLIEILETIKISSDIHFSITNKDIILY